MKNMYEVRVEAVVTKIMTISAETEEQANEFATERFSLLEDGCLERYRQDIVQTDKYPRLVGWDDLVGAINKAIEDLDDEYQISRFAKEKLGIEFSSQEARGSLVSVFFEVESLEVPQDVAKIAADAIGGRCEYHEEGIFLFESEEDSTDVFTGSPLCEITMAEFYHNGKAMK